MLLSSLELVVEGKTKSTNNNAPQREQVEAFRVEGVYGFRNRVGFYSIQRRQLT